MSSLFLISAKRSSAFSEKRTELSFENEDSAKDIFSGKFVFFEEYSGYNSISRYRPYAASNFVIAEKETDITLPGTYTDGQLFYFYDSAENVIKKYSSSTVTLTTNTDYIVQPGRSALNFHYKHYAGQDTRIDPSVSNIVDIYMLERNYDKDLATGTIAASGTLGILIPPSIMLVIMADLLAISVGTLFVASVMPGLLLASLYF